MASTTRFEFRISELNKAFIEKAASLQGESAGAFVRHAALQRAEQVFAEHDYVTTIPPDFFDELNAALETADPPTPALIAAIAQLDALVDRE